MNNRNHYARFFLLITGLMLILGACQDHGQVPQADIALRATSLGTVLTNQEGRTLYFFAPDVNGQSNCNGNCAVVWPPFYRENPSLGTGLAAANFTTIMRADGSRQTAYKGWPLYTFRTDAAAGEVRGENVGNAWSVAKPDYTVVRGSGQLVGNDGNNYTSAYVVGTGTTTYLTDAQGLTLYTFVNDRRNTNTFTRADFSNNATWPIVEASAIAEIPSAFNKADFGTITVFGRSQLTFRGWPVYYFGADARQRGSTKGVSVGRTPGFWPLLTPTLAVAP